MHKIEKIQAQEILDSRGIPTLRVWVYTDQGACGIASVPSGASTGEHEALELRDKDPKRYLGKGVLQAVKNVEGPLFSKLKGQAVEEQEKIDQILCDLDGTKNKSHFGANAILGVSMAVAVAASQAKNLPLFSSLRKQENYILPCPMMNVINGGVHADNTIDFQEFMIRPHGAKTFQEALRMGGETFHTLKGLLQKKGLSTSVGDEGGFAPLLSSPEEVLDLLIEAVKKAGFEPKKQISLALDVAASELYEETKYVERKKKEKKQPYQKRTREAFVGYLEELCKKYPLDSLEDGLDQNDWQGWKILTQKLGKKVQIVGDDIFVTNPSFLQKGITEKCGNAILIKLNQIGTVTETMQTIDLAHKHKYQTIISHRSGETEDTFIADLAVATNAGQIKTGSLSRSDRIAKYNRLLTIEKILSKKGCFKDSNPYK